MSENTDVVMQENPEPIPTTSPAAKIDSPIDQNLTNILSSNNTPRDILQNLADIPSESENSTEDQVDIREQLSALGITIQKITRDEESMIQRRDFWNMPGYPNLILVDYKYKKGIQRRGLFIDGRIVGFSTSGVYEMDGKNYGEIGMIHISPAIRGLGLGSLLNYLAREELLALNPEILTSMVGDETGKIEHILQELNFTSTGKKINGQPILEKDISDPAVREGYRQTLKKLTIEKIKTLQPQKDELKKKTDEVDYDNPSVVNIEKTVEERLQEWGPHIIDRIFGYQNGKVWIRKEYTDRENGYDDSKGTSIEIELFGMDQEKVFETLTKAGKEVKIITKPLIYNGKVYGEETYAELTYNGNTYLVRQLGIGGKNQGTRIYSNFTKDENMIGNNIKNAASIAQVIVDSNKLVEHQ